MKFSEKLYLFLERIPSSLIIIIQILLIGRFLIKYLEITTQNPGVNILLDATYFLTLPVALVLKLVHIPENTIVFEALLLTAASIYGVLYEIIRIILQAITHTEEE